MLKNFAKRILSQFSSSVTANVDLCIVTTNSEWGGSEAVWVKLAQGFIEDKKKVIIFARHELIQQLRTRNISALKECQIIPYDINRKILNSTRIFTSLLINKPKLAYISQLHAMDGQFWMQNFIALNIPFINFIPLCLPSAWPNDHFLENMRSNFQRSSLIMFDSNKNLEFFDVMMGSNFLNKIKVSYPIEEFSDFKNLSDEIVRFGIMARFDCFHKGYDILLRALTLIKCEKWTLKIVGHGHHKILLENLIKLYNLENKVTVESNVPKTVFFSNIDVALFPSRFEGTPLLLLDAIISKSICVVNDVGGMAELIEEGHTGFVSPFPSPESFADAIERCLKRRESWSIISSAAKKRLIEENLKSDIISQVKKVANV